ncbi:tRNA acetyltransferase TAN1 [Triangularia verruculosa]|uniref:tRNA acetyltransferase TAN1 n=1 Tax=Triangularia verruculosa TaxID=2587418 RepID=A0AAN6XA46_9PEZI|nr:tRNA acetyltransferase TAN1 [Triangularia verruculosa]
MTGSGKRKEAPTGGGGAQQAKKKKAGGNAGKWKTPHQMAKTASSQESSLQAGEPGIWVTCARHQESKAAREIGVLFAEYADKMYGIKGVHDAEKKEGGEDEEDDIEAAIKKEVEALNANRKGTDGGHNMTPLKMNVDCLMFVKTKPPIDPVAFVKRIVVDAKSASETGQMKCRYVNRLTPVSVTGKATEQGLEAIAREALAPFFDLSGKRAGLGNSTESAAKPATETEGGNEAADTKANEAGIEKKPSNEAAQPTEKGFTFAIRPSVRNNSSLKRDAVINTIAGLINDERHKVNLTSPDKVILVDVYQKVCGISVVDGDWEELKRYNLTELYGQGQGSKEKEKAKAKEEGGVDGKDGNVHLS